MITIHPNKLAADVEAVNSANAAAFAFWPKLARLLIKHAGQKIVKATPYRSFTKAFETQYREAVGEHDLTKPSLGGVAIYSSFIVFSVSARAFYKWHPDDRYERDTDHRVEWYVNIDSDGRLPESIVPPIPGRSDWTVTEVQALQEAREQARKALSRAEEALGPFQSR